METITIDHQNGNSTTYKIVDGTAFHIETPTEVVNILKDNLHSNVRLQIYYGDIETGRNWNEEHDTTGTIGRSTGKVKIPLLIKTARSYGGGSILDHCIVKIKNKKTGKVLYQIKNYSPSTFEIVPTDMPDKYSHNVNIDGKLYSRHKTERSAKLLVKKLS